MVGADSKAWLEDFTKQIDEAKKLLGKDKKAVVETEEQSEPALGRPVKRGRPAKTAVIEEDFLEEESQNEESFGDDDDFEETPKKVSKASKKAKAATFEDEEELEAEESDEEETSEIDVADLKSGKKYTIQDVNKACNNRAKATSVGEVMGILRRKFKVTSVGQLKDVQFADVIKAVSFSR